jgi:hypothetical protein
VALVYRAIVAGSLLVGCGPVIAEPSADSGDGSTTGATIDPPLDTATSTPGSSDPGTSVGTTEPGTVATSDDPSDDTTRGTTVNDTFEPDGGTLIRECDVWSQDCPDGEKCNAWANDGGDRWNAAYCFPIVPNPAQLGDECVVEGSPTSGLDNCDHGLMCFHADAETHVGTCVALCGGSEMKPLCNDDATTCTISHEGTIILCLPVCDPLLQDCAHAGDACMPTYDGDAFTCFPTYQPSAAAGEPCEYRDSCIAGTACLPGDLVVGCAAQSCCTPFCENADPDADLGCPGYDGGEVCDSWYAEGGAPGRPRLPIGVCVIPS